MFEREEGRGGLTSILVLLVFCGKGIVISPRNLIFIIITILVLIAINVRLGKFLLKIFLIGFLYTLHHPKEALV